MANPSGESSDYKLTDLDYLIGDHHLQMIKAALPFLEQDLIDLAKAFIEGQTPMEQLRRLLSPEQQARFETLQMMVTAFQAMA